MLSRLRKYLSTQHFMKYFMQYFFQLNRWAKWSIGAAALIFLLFIFHLLLGWQRTSSFNPQLWLKVVDDEAYHATIQQDQWGVPHISGKRDEDVAFGVAFIHATDALPDLETILRLYLGRMGLAEGYRGLATDGLLHLLQVNEVTNSQWQEVPEKVRKVLSAYAHGLNYYAAEHPDLVDHTLYPISGEDLLAGMHLQQLMFYGLDKVLQQLISGDVTELQASPQGSNAIAISPGRGWGTTHLLINSHQPLTGPLSWYEMSLSSEEGWEIYGGGFIGSPFVYIGAHKELGWGSTVNKPGLTDLYRLEIHPDAPRRYRMDGVWWDMEVIPIELPFKLFGNFYWTVSHELEYSHHGPVFRNDEGTYALYYAGMREVRHAEQWYRMNKARNRDEWMAAMQMRAIPSLNFVYADAASNIDYIYNASLRLRPADISPYAVLDGTSTKLLELPLVPFDLLPQLHNPNAGWLSSTNQTPQRVTQGQENPIWPNHWRIETEINNRSLRVEELMLQSGPINAQKLLQIKMDKQYSKRFRHLHWLDSIRDNFEPRTRILEDMQRELLHWDLKADAANQQAAAGVCMVQASARAEKQKAVFELLPSLQECADRIKRYSDTMLPTWGDMLRLKRGKKSWPLGGGPDLLRAIYFDQSEDGTLSAVAGDGLTIFAEWQDGTFKVSAIHQFGSSRIAGSPHYADQAPLFSAEELREPFDPSNLETRKITFHLRIPY